MNKPEYRRYLQSDDWAARRTEYFAMHERRCQCCETTSNVDLHHRTYERVGKELDGDLTPLCRTCHELVHNYYSIGGKSLPICTYEVIAYRRGFPLNRPNRVAKRMKLAQALASPGLVCSLLA